MPITRSAFQRYRLIDEIISRYPRRYSKQRLFELCQDKCGIRSISSLEKDIQRMREDHDAPIEYDKRANGYYYSNPQFRLLNLMLSPDDMEALDYAREVLAATQGATVADELTNALQKVRQSLDIIHEVRSDDRGAQATSRRIVYVEEKILGGNRQFVPILIRAVNQSRQVAFRYLKYEDVVQATNRKTPQKRKQASAPAVPTERPKLRILHPILLREVADSWYVIGYDAVSGREKTFALDRMSELELLDDPCDVPPTILANVSELFEHIYGITDSHGPVEDIVLSFSPLFGQYVKAKPIHQTQEVLSDTETECVVRLRLAPNRDLLMHLRSYGEHLTVLEPASLVQEIKTSLEATLSRY
ncbi:helix-turn-helix transcriptional regulator [Spirosoma fluviale]|uniref:Predicted DNA-binding transcriptional regulator YafY, contains an HTH and WYL domains n=1 Tax=Spirosoma fluviale TaxID=1597977 RepID=A0A286G1I9_9BACT|nr:WYL domain-containing protein [Spirosoma fluviale]SOD89312.1 Predicted DNA-binding transcriptional regulator YafY, contains an HTH and WYL domains [Spirosoma fluviale]